MPKALGIDLGTYNSAAAFAVVPENPRQKPNVIMVESRYGPSLFGKNFPSFVLFDFNGKKQMVGKLAKAQGYLTPKLLVWGVKRLIGLSYDEAERRGEFSRFKYEKARGPNNSILIKVGEELYTPAKILEFILREIKEDAENTRLNPNIGEDIDRLVVSVPAYFDGTRVGPIKQAAQDAGFSNVDTIAEPTAATLQYDLKTSDEAIILTFDMGAGTLDVTILKELKDGEDTVRGEASTSGEEALGGIDMDDAIVKYLSQKYGIGQMDAGVYSTFRDDVEGAKIRLSTQFSTSIYTPTGQSFNFTRDELEEVLRPLLEKIRGPIRVALKQAGLRANQLDYILFVGGPTYMPCVRSTVKDELTRLGARKDLLQQLEAFEKELPINPMECVARGACLKACGVFTLQKDPNGYGTTLGSEYYSIIPPNSSLPITRTKGIVHYNPQALHVPISLVRKRLYFGENAEKPLYHHLGDYDVYIRSTGERPEVDITMHLDNDRKLTTTFTHRQTRISVRFERLNDLSGDEITLEEPHDDDDDDDDTETKKRHPPQPPPIVTPRVWTERQLYSAIHSATGIMDTLAEDSHDTKVNQKKSELLGLIQSPADPQRDTPIIMDRIMELLNALANAGILSEKDFHYHRERLREIERMG